MSVLVDRNDEVEQVLHSQDREKARTQRKIGATGNEKVCVREGHNFVRVSLLRNAKAAAHQSHWPVLGPTRTRIGEYPAARKEGNHQLPRCVRDGKLGPADVQRKSISPSPGTVLCWASWP